MFHEFENSVAQIIKMISPVSPIRLPRHPQETSRMVVLKALHNSSGFPKTLRPLKSPLSLFANSSATLSSLSLPTTSLGWDVAILLDLSCNFKVATTSLWSVWLESAYWTQLQQLFGHGNHQSNQTNSRCNHPP